MQDLNGLSDVILQIRYVDVDTNSDVLPGQTFVIVSFGFSFTAFPFTSELCLQAASQRWTDLAAGRRCS